MTSTTYRFARCLGGFFEMSSVNARSLLPKHLQAIEVQHTRAVLAILGFQFRESEVGAYDELVMAIITPPRVEPGSPLPKAAFFPFVVATSTESSRLHATERWHLPNYATTLDFSFREDREAVGVHVSDRGSPVLSLSVTPHRFTPMTHMYHSFMVSPTDGAAYKVSIQMGGPYSEHEEERGTLVLNEHGITEGLDLDELDRVPFREEWYRNGVQVFGELERL